MNRSSERWTFVTEHSGLRVYQDKNTPLGAEYKRFRVDRRVFFFFWFPSMIFICLQSAAVPVSCSHDERHTDEGNGGSIQGRLDVCPGRLQGHGKSWFGFWFQDYDQGRAEE